jgi:hypothetical protein
MSDTAIYLELGRLSGRCHALETELGIPHPPEPVVSASGMLGIVIDDLQKRIFKIEDRAWGRGARADDGADNGKQSDAEDLERDGNLVCMPGVTLAKVRSKARRGRRR